MTDELFGELITKINGTLGDLAINYNITQRLSQSLKQRGVDPEDAKQASIREMGHSRHSISCAWDWAHMRLMSIPESELQRWPDIAICDALGRLRICLPPGILPIQVKRFSLANWKQKENTAAVSSQPEDPSSSLQSEDVSLSQSEDLSSLSQSEDSPPLSQSEAPPSPSQPEDIPSASPTSVIRSPAAAALLAMGSRPEPGISYDFFDASIPHPVLSRQVSAELEQNVSKDAFLDLPMFVVEYKKADEDRHKATNQSRMYLVACVKFLAALGIVDFPVWGAQTDGSKVVLIAAIQKSSSVPVCLLSSAHLLY